jgi:hypothetical protein
MSSRGRFVHRAQCEVDSSATPIILPLQFEMARGRPAPGDRPALFARCFAPGVTQNVWKGKVAQIVASLTAGRGCQNTPLTGA